MARLVRRHTHLLNEALDRIYLARAFTCYQVITLVTNTILAIGLAAVSLTMIVAAIYVQVFRYRNVSTSEQRLRTKWVLFGIALWFVVNIASAAGWSFALQLPVDTPVPVWLPLAALTWTISSLFLPASLTISITRFRLFEIELIINRSLLKPANQVQVSGITTPLISESSS